MRYAILTLAAAVLSVGPAFGQAVTAQDVIKKAIEAHGGADVLNKYPAATSKMKGTLTVGLSKTPFSGALAFAVPGKIRFTIVAESGGLKTTFEQIVNGDKVVQLENGKSTTLSDTLRKELQHAPGIQEMSMLTPLLDEKKYTLERAKDMNVAGNPTYAVIVTPKAGKPVTMYFDAKSGLLVKTSRKALSPNAQEVTEDSTFSDFRKAAGMIVPMKLSVEHDGQAFMDVTVSDYTPLEKIDDKTFDF